MNENVATVQLKDAPDQEQSQIANMDQYDFMMMLMESRIIQAS